MTARDVRIELNGTGRGTITVDGVPLRGVHSLTLDSEAGQRTVLRLELLMHDVGTFANAADVLIPEDTAATLVALGWTPPPGQEVTDASP